MTRSAVNNYSWERELNFAFSPESLILAEDLWIGTP